MKPASIKPVRCAVYTRVSTDQGLDQEFNSLDAQYDAASAYIKSQAHAGWAMIRRGRCVLHARTSSIRSGNI
jgi:site-specific DNA recombinase